MASEGPERAEQAPSLTSLPRVEDLPSAADGYDRERVREAFEAFRRHTTQLQVQLRVLQAAGHGGSEPTGHAVRMDSLHMIRAAAEMADTIERDAQTASAAQLRRTEEEVTRRQHELQERQREGAEILNAAKSESRQTLQEAQQQAAQEVSEAESRAARLLEQARHQATELTNATRAEIEQTLEWARGQAGAIISRAQEGAEQLLGAAGLGDEAVGRVAQSIVGAAQAAAEASRGSGPGIQSATQLREPEAAAEPEREREREQEPEPGAQTPPFSPPVSAAPSPSETDDEPQG